jgi:hypothetical protein
LWKISHGASGEPHLDLGVNEAMRNAVVVILNVA